MPESELAARITKLIKMADKLVRDIRKDTADLRAALKELEGKHEDDKGKG